jgi:type IV pilus assembly protein PilA
MIKSTLARRREIRVREFGEEAADAGFTLIELMVVLLIIAILLAIAIPTFLGVSGSANDRAAQSNLSNALIEVKALYQNNQTYLTTSMTPAQLTGSAPEFSWVQAGAVPAAAKGTNAISEYPVDIATAGDGLGVIMASWAKGTGTCWYAVDLEAAPQATFGADAAPGTIQFLSAAAGANAQENSAGAALTSAGVFYAQRINAATCNAANPTTAGPWKWGTSFSNAPTA